jgi:hypothetical protein
VAMTEDQEEEIEKQIFSEDEELVNVDGTKVKLSGKLVKHAEEIKRRSLVLKGLFIIDFIFGGDYLTLIFDCSQCPRKPCRVEREGEQVQ